MHHKPKLNDSNENCKNTNNAKRTEAKQNKLFSPFKGLKLQWKKHFKKVKLETALEQMKMENSKENINVQNNQKSNECKKIEDDELKNEKKLCTSIEKLRSPREKKLAKRVILSKFKNNSLVTKYPAHITPVLRYVF
jgi:hypothetical protein